MVFLYSFSYTDAMPTSGNAFVTMNAIMHYQEEYFLDGDDKLKPMILKDIMVVLIFRRFHVANSKYVETPYGTKLIKEFF
jgi:RNA polymerase sigma-54 factor